MGGRGRAQRAPGNRGCCGLAALDHSHPNFINLFFRGRSGGLYRVVRDGGVHNSAGACRSAYRGGCSTGSQGFHQRPLHRAAGATILAVW